MSQELMNICNSAPLWIFAVILVLLVLAQSGLFMRLCFKEAKAINYPAESVKSSFKIGMSAAFGPALSNFLAMLSMMAVVGSPITWMRLSIIGAATTELGVATITASVLGMDGLAGLATPANNISVISLIFLMMAIVGSGWLLVCILAMPSMNAIRAKVIEKDPKWFAALTGAASIGLFSNMAAQQVQVFAIGKYFALFVAFIVMYLCNNVLGKKNDFWKKNAMTFSILLGMTAGGFAEAWF